MSHRNRPPADAIDRLRLARTEGVGPVAYRRLLARYGSAAAALDALPGLARAGGRPAPPAVPSPDDAERELHAVGRLGARMIFAGEPDYPPLLALLDDAPAAIAVLGDAALLANRAVALVGGRNASANGQRMAETLAADLARSLVVVSGLARGIDAAAHTGALQTGRTVAAVAGGLDDALPARARRPATPDRRRRAPWSPRRRSAPRPRRATSRAATGSSPASPSASWWWRRRCVPAA